MARKKRVNGDGTIYRFKNGWRLQLSLTGPDGKKRRVTRFSKFQSDLVAIRQVLIDGERKAVQRHTDLTVSQWLSEWLEAGKSTWAANTRQTYRHMVDRWIRGRIGAIRLAALTIRDARKLLQDCAEAGAGLRTQQAIRETLMSAYNLALKERHVAENPIRGVAKPKGVRSAEISPFTDEERNKLIEASRGTRHHALVTLGLTLGLRWGELAGLTKDRVDLKARTIHVDQQLVEVWGEIDRTDPKTEHAKRTLSLPDAAVQALIEHHAMQLRDGTLTRPELFLSTEGSTLRRANFSSRAWASLQRQCDIKPRGFHQCRHTFATSLLRAGVSVHIVSRMLGHSSPDITLRVYSHYVPDDQRMALEVINAKTSVAGCVHIACRESSDETKPIPTKRVTSG